ncbi:hypothetical protein KKI19_01810 [Patescibacteria group bacterium]|nr:hypothetical protein [Patescibacteria group bacterium]
MDWKHRLSRLTSILLIGSGVYQVIYSSVLIIFVYPHLKSSVGESGILLYESLIEKALVYYASMIVNGIYGISLLFKPKEEVTYLQIIGGLIVFALGILFITKTEATADPIINLFIRAVKLITG